MYTAEISRVNPTCFLFLIDQSYSMADPFGGGEIQASKAAILADVINRLLDTLVGRCSKGEGMWRYFQVGVIGYGASVKPAFGGALSGQDLVWIDDIANNPLRVEDRVRKVYDGAGGQVEITAKFPVWFESTADNGTPMFRAMWHAHATLEDWVAGHPEAFPPVVINITDGESTDGDPAPVSEAIRELATEDGNVVLLNLHLSSQRSPQILFPDNPSELPDDYARLLFEMSSILPEPMRQMALEMRYNVSATSRGFFFNVRDITDVIQFLDIGTRAANLR